MFENVTRHSYDIGVPGALTLTLHAWPARLEAGFTDRGRHDESRPAIPSILLDGVQIDQLPEGGFRLAFARDALEAPDHARILDGLSRCTPIIHL